MSDFNSEMYNSMEELPTKPQLVSQQKISLSNLGKMTRAVIDGKEVFIVDPSVINQLSTRVATTENNLRDQSIKLDRALGVINSLQIRIVELERNLGRIFND
jgi:hypothetical protein